MEGLSKMILKGRQAAARREYSTEAAILGGSSSTDARVDANAPVAGSSEWAAQKLRQNAPAAPAEVPTGIAPTDVPEGFVRKVMQGNVGRQRMSERGQGRG